MFEILTAVVSVAALALSVFSVLRKRKLTLAQIATLACDHGAAAEGKTLPRWKLAHEAAVRLDERDNGKRDYTDRQLRLAVDAEAAKRGWKAGQ